MSKRELLMKALLVMGFFALLFSPLGFAYADYGTFAESTATGGFLEHQWDDWHDDYNPNHSYSSAYVHGSYEINDEEGGSFGADSIAQGDLYSLHVESYANAEAWGGYGGGESGVYADAGSDAGFYDTYTVTGDNVTMGIDIALSGSLFADGWETNNWSYFGFIISKDEGYYGSDVYEAGAKLYNYNNGFYEGDVWSSTGELTADDFEQQDENWFLDYNETIYLEGLEEGESFTLYYTLLSDAVAGGVYYEEWAEAWTEFMDTASIELYAIGGTIEAASGEPVPAVPIPGAIWLFGSGLICLVGIGRRFSKNQSSGRVVD